MPLNAETAQGKNRPTDPMAITQPPAAHLWHDSFSYHVDLTPGRNAGSLSDPWMIECLSGFDYPTLQHSPLRPHLV